MRMGKSTSDGQHQRQTASLVNRGVYQVEIIWPHRSSRLVAEGTAAPIRPFRWLRAIP
jgi:hypothetical protein